MSESRVLREVQLEASRLGARVLRNQVGQYKLADGRYLRSGLCVGSSDLIGWYSRTITPHDVGSTIAVFTAIECKSGSGRLSDEQKQFIDAVLLAGGIAGCVRDINGLTNLLRK